MIRRCGPADREIIHEIINAAAQKYRGVIPDDCWHEPYMSRAELDREIAAGVTFWGDDDDGVLLGVMGIQAVRDVHLIRHAYVRPSAQGRGVGGRLLAHLAGMVSGQILIGTWSAATWAIRFYQSHGYALVPESIKSELLRRYWTVSDRQIETSVVLANPPVATIAS